MCLAVPMRVVSIEGTKGTVELGGVEQLVSLQFTPGVSPGDYVIVHAGFALERLDEDDARRTIELLNQLAAASEDNEPGPRN